MLFSLEIKSVFSVSSTFKSYKTCKATYPTLFQVKKIKGKTRLKEILSKEKKAIDCQRPLMPLQ